MSILDLPKLLSIDIEFIVIADGIILIASTNKTCSADTYCAPIKESTDSGTKVIPQQLVQLRSG